MFLSEKCVRGLAIAAVVASIGLVAWSAPITMLGALPGEVRSLAHLERVRFVVDPLPKMIYDAGVRMDRARKSWTEKLIEAGIVVVDDADAPKLRLTVVSKTDETVEGAVAYVMLLTLEQSVHIPRIDANVQIPTWTGVDVFLRAEDQLAQGFRGSMNYTFDKFLQRIRLATNRF